MKVFLTLVLIAICQVFLGQGMEGKKEVHLIDSEVFGAERKIVVYTPPFYEDEKDMRLNVLYVFDAQFDPLFNYVTATCDYLSGTASAQPYLVVGIQTEERRHEFTPPCVHEETIKQWGEDAKPGGAVLMDKFLQREVFPFIDKNYRINPYKMAIGHSLGGTYVLNTLSEDANLFNSFIAISPNLDFDQEAIIDRISRCLASKKELNSYLYVSVGDTGSPDDLFIKGIQRLDTLISKRNLDGLKYRFRYLEDANHSTGFAKAIPEALLGFEKMFAKPDKTTMDSLLVNDEKAFVPYLIGYYQKIAVWLGYDYVPDEWVLNGIAYECLNAQKPNVALEVLDWAIKNYPKGINLYDSKGEMLYDLGKKKKAIAAYKMALEKLEEYKSDIYPDDYDYYKEIINLNLGKIK
ncbi:alpha/beta hydrolase [Marinilabiliaceae bacterium JC017]|nr:alpha/beta hydrolase [Marinilabiliaceae bacterium JC017]